MLMLFMSSCLESNAETEKERGRRRGRRWRGERIPPQLQGDEEVKPAPLYSSLSRLELISPALLPPAAPVLPLRSGGTLNRHGRIQTLTSSSHFVFSPAALLLLLLLAELRLKSSDVGGHMEI